MKLTKFGVASKNYDNAKDARGDTYTTSDDKFPPTILIPPQNPYEVTNAQYILDFGCGVGRNLPWVMENTDAHYVGLDPNTNMTDYFWDVQDEKYKDRVTLINDFSELPDVKFDWIVATYVFQHLGYRYNTTPNLTDIYNILSSYTHEDSHWFLIEHDSEEDWINRFCLETGVKFKVYERGYNWQEELTHRDSTAPNGGHHLLIW